MNLQKVSGTILYMTDRFKVSAGYEPAFTKMLNQVGITRQQVIVTDIYGLVQDPLYKKANEKLWRFNPEKLPQVAAAFAQRVRAIRPKVIVCSDPAVLGVLVNGDSRLGTIDKCRGGVYFYEGIPCIVTYPITVIHSHVDERLLKDIEGDDTKEQPYRMPLGAWVLRRDWEKVGRYFRGKPRKLPEFQYSVCRSVEDLAAAEKFLTQCVGIAVDIETGCHPAQQTCVGYYGMLRNGQARGFVIPFYDSTQENGCFWADPVDHAYALNTVAAINESPAIKIMQNGAYDCSYFIRDRVPVNNYICDVMLLWFSLYMELPKSLDFISSILIDSFQYWKDDIKGIEDKDQTNVGMETYWRYNAKDCYFTLFNAMYLIQLLRGDNRMQENYNDVFMRMLSGLAMSMRGVRVDRDRQSYHRERLIEEATTAQERVRYLVADSEFNINSPAQKNSLLYDVFGVRERNARGRFVDPSKPRKGANAPSSGAIPLKMIKSEHPLFKYVIEALESAMEPDKQLSNIFGRVEDGRVKGGLYCPTGRFRTAFSAAGTETTRFSSKKSNFWDGGNAQNIRKKFRDFLVADEGCIFMEVDYSQSDDVFVGYESNDPNKIAVIESGVDGHAVHGELFFRKPYAEIVAGKKAGDPLIVHPTTGIRQLSKRVVHGTNFQMAAITLYMTMGRDAVVAAAKLLGHHDADSWPQDRLVQICAYFMSLYRKKYPRLTPKEWYGEIAAQLKKTGTITNAFGITRRFMGDASDNGTQREATAFVGQSDTAGNMNRTMYEIDHGFIPKRFRDGENPEWDDTPRKMNWESHGFSFMLQVHDSFLIQLNTRHPRWMEAAHNLLYVMERPIIINGHSVRVKTEAEFMRAWGSKESIEWKFRADNANDQLESIASTLLKKGA